MIFKPSSLSFITLLLAISFAFAAPAQDTFLKPFAAAEKEMMVDVEGGKVYVRLNGLAHSEAIPVVFIHGGPGGTHNGFASMTGLADERMVIMYDQLDSGKSEQPNDPANWYVKRFIDELDSVRQALGIERWHVVGHSWGSAIALEYTAAHSDRVVSTVLGGTFISTPMWIMDANLLIQVAPEDVQNTLKQCESNAPPEKQKCSAAYKTLYSRYYNPPGRTAAAKAYYDNVGGNGFNPVIYNGMWGPSEFSSTGTLRNFDAIPLLAEIKPTKTLFMIGQYDSARIDTVQNYLTLTPGAELAVVPGAAHGIYTDRPIEVEALLRGWLSRRDPH